MKRENMPAVHVQGREADRHRIVSDNAFACCLFLSVFICNFPHHGSAVRHSGAHCVRHAAGNSDRAETLRHFARRVVHHTRKPRFIECRPRETAGCVNIGILAHLKEMIDIRGLRRDDSAFSSLALPYIAERVMVPVRP